MWGFSRTTDTFSSHHHDLSSVTNCFLVKWQQTFLRKFDELCRLALPGDRNISHSFSIYKLLSSAFCRTLIHEIPAVHFDIKFAVGGC